MAQQWKAPSSLGDEIKLLFDTSDIDGNGVLSVDEIKRMLQHLDPSGWHEEAVSKLCKQIDANADGRVQFTEFWSWIAGHGRDGKNSFKEQLLTQAIAEDHVNFDQQQERLQVQKEADEKREQQTRRNSQKDVEREAGERITKTEFIENGEGVGLNRHVAAGMFAKGDEDNDGEIDRQEAGWLANEQATTVGQIKGIFKTSYETVADGSDDAAMEEIVNAFSAWDKDGDGTVSSEELIRVIRTLNPKLGELTAANMIKQADTNKDGSIDVREFVGWISGVSPKKKKAKDIRNAKIAMALHKKRSSEAKQDGLQASFEGHMHSAYSDIAKSKRIPVHCGTLNPGPNCHRLCGTCHNRHVWLCHGCGFISYYDDCVNGCIFGNFGWTCIQGECKKKCGCKKKPEIWQRRGFLQDVDTLSADVKRLLGVCEEEGDISVLSP